MDFDLGVGDAGLEVEDGVAGKWLAARGLGNVHLREAITHQVGRP